MCAVAVLASSLTAVADDPARFGWVWTAKPDLDSDDPDATLEALATEDDLTAVGALQQGSLELDGSGIDGFAVDVRKGSIAFDVVDGRAPTSPGEVALGAQALAGVDIGDSVETTTPDGDPLALVVVGRAVMPQFDSSRTTSAWLTSEGMTALAPDAERSLVLTYAPSGEPVALEARLEEQYGISYPTYRGPTRPGASCTSTSYGGCSRPWRSSSRSLAWSASSMPWRWPAAATAAGSPPSDRWASSAARSGAPWSPAPPRWSWSGRWSGSRWASSPGA